MNDWDDMPFFNHTLSGQEILALSSMCLALVYWLFVLFSERAGNRWLKERLRQRAEKKLKDTPRNDSPDMDDDTPKGPWG